MAAVLSISPSLGVVFIGQSYRLRIQIRDSEVRRPYDCTGATSQSLWLVSLTGGAARQVPGTVTWENIAMGICSVPIVNADTAALTPGRWYLELRVPTVTAEGGGTLIPALFPFDVAALP